MTDTTLTGGEEGFAARIQELHVPVPKADREVLMLRVGTGLVVAGIVMILIGYWGVSGTADIPDQISYAMSGGIGGLALVIVGSALIMRFSLARLFRFWLARVVYEHQVQTDRTIEALGRIEAALTRSAVPPPPLPQRPPPGQ
jgi:hypothetical protein